MRPSTEERLAHLIVWIRKSLVKAHEKARKAREEGRSIAAAVEADQDVHYQIGVQTGLIEAAIVIGYDQVMANVAMLEAREEELVYEERTA